MLTSCSIVYETSNYYVVQQQDGSIDWSTMQKIIPPKAEIDQHKKKSASTAKVIHYDTEAPVHIRKPKLLEPSKGYISSDMSTFPIYGDAHIVEEPAIKKGKNSLAIWCTKEATYIAQIHHHYWKRTYYQCPSGTYIRDCSTGDKYYIKDHWGLPLDQTFFIDGISGEYICLVSVFPPLPETCTVIDLIEPHVTDIVDGGPGWGHDDSCVNMSVAELQANQNKIKYKETKVIE